MDNMEKTEERKEKLQDLDKRAKELKLKVRLGLLFNYYYLHTHLK